MNEAARRGNRRDAEPRLQALPDSHPAHGHQRGVDRLHRQCGSQHQTSKDSLTATVTRIPKMYASKEEAVQAAKEYIDRQESREQGAQKQDAPASAT